MSIGVKIAQPTKDVNDPNLKVYELQLLSSRNSLKETARGKVNADTPHSQNYIPLVLIGGVRSDNKKQALVIPIISRTHFGITPSVDIPTYIARLYKNKLHE